MQGIRISVAAAIAAAGFAALPVAAQGQSGEGDYVPRSEYEKLKEDFQELKKTVQKQRSVRDKQIDREVKEYMEARDRAVEAAEKEEAGMGFFELREYTPGWERVRGEGWMSPTTNKNLFDVEIARLKDLRVYAGLDTAGRIQYLQQDDVQQTRFVDTDNDDRPDQARPGTPNDPLEPGFQTAWGNLRFLANFDDKIEVYFNLFLSSRPHADSLQGDEGYLVIRDLPGGLGNTSLGNQLFEHLDFKAGEFKIDFGDAHFRRSNNANAQRNPLVGNYVVDPRGTNIAVSAIGNKGPIKWLASVGAGDATGDFQAGSGYSVNGKIWAHPAPDLRLSFSGYHADHSQTATGFPNAGTDDQLFHNNRSGGMYGGVMADGNAPGQVTPGNGQRVTALQYDATYDPANRPFEIYTHVGWVQDADLNGTGAGSPREAWLYYAAEGVYNFTDRLYAAARYSGASALSLTRSGAERTVLGRSSSGSGIVHRIQVGGGYWLHKNILTKLELVYQKYDDFEPAGGQVSGVDVWQDPEFYGLISEVTFSF